MVDRAILEEPALIPLELFPGEVAGVVVVEHERPILGDDATRPPFDPGLLAGQDDVAGPGPPIDIGARVSRIVEDGQDTPVIQGPPVQLAVAAPSVMATGKVELILGEILDHAERGPDPLEGVEDQTQRLLDLLIGVKDELADGVVDQPDGGSGAELAGSGLFQLAPQEPPAKAASGRPNAHPPPIDPLLADFDVVLAMIAAARTRAFTAVNATLIDLYWNIGDYIIRKIAENGWGKGTVKLLSETIQRRYPGVSGYSPQNLWRMRQFSETYRQESILSPLVRELPWTHNLLIMSRCKRDEEREFYLRLCLHERWGKRELERQLSGALFERTILNPPKLVPAVRELHPEAATVFKDSYFVEFLHLPLDHSERDLEQGLIGNLKQFLIELGRDFCFIGSQYPLQVGGRDFFLDLLFFNRALNCLVVFELKIDQFQPEHLGKLEFYLEALDRDVKKSHEQPSIGVLLCATKDQEVVEYALSRTMSPALVSEYQTRLPDKNCSRPSFMSFTNWLRNRRHCRL